MDDRIPNHTDIILARQRLDSYIRKTPVWEWRGENKERFIHRDTQLFFKLELFQVAGCFKPRGALTVMFNQSRDNLSAGITAVSGGNHAIAVSSVAKLLKTTADSENLMSYEPILMMIDILYGANHILMQILKCKHT